MEYVFRLSGEHPKLPREELKAVLEGCGIDYDIVSDTPAPKLTRISVRSPAGVDDRVIRRLGMTLRAGRVIASAPTLEDLFPGIRQNLPLDGTVAVRSGSQKDDKALGAILYSAGYRIDLTKPDTGILVYKTPEGYVAAVDIPMERSFSKRRPQFRPYFSPISMHPKLARVLVNLSGVREGNSILDPFCGTGGILIEAGLVGLELHGSDIDDKMVYGCRRNLEFYGLSGDIRRLDVSQIREFGHMDAVVTDPPYARSSYVTARDLQGFYESFVSSAKEVLKPGGRLVYMVPEEFVIAAEGMEQVAEYAIRVHKSLTRKVVVCRKS